MTHLCRLIYAVFGTWCASKKISYVVITPRASANGDSTYLNIMQGGSTRLEQFLAQLQSTLGVFVDMEPSLFADSEKVAEA